MPTDDRADLRVPPAAAAAVAAALASAATPGGAPSVQQLHGSRRSFQQTARCDDDVYGSLQAALSQGDVFELDAAGRGRGQSVTTAAVNRCASSSGTGALGL